MKISIILTTQIMQIIMITLKMRTELIITIMKISLKLKKMKLIIMILIAATIMTAVMI